MTTTAVPVTFDYQYTNIGDILVTTAVDKKTGVNKAEAIEINGEKCFPTVRFWTSLFARYGFNNAFFKYYTHEEVFARISQKETDDRMRVCIERKDGRASLLAVSNPKRPLVVHDELVALLAKYHGERITYNDGIVESVHDPRVSMKFTVGGDLFRGKFMMACPVDGYGQPNIFLALLREVCQNSVVGYSKAFKSQLSLGSGLDDVGPSIIRALDGFSNDEGYAALRQRVEMSAKSWASVKEANTLYRLLARCHHQNALQDRGAAVPFAATSINGFLKRPDTDRILSTMGEAEPDVMLRSPLVTAYHKMTGDTSRLYGLANLDALSTKRQQALPVKCTVYDLMNFASETGTHFAKPNGERLMNDYVGSLICNEFDLEGTVDHFADFADFHMEQRLANQLTG